MAEQLINEFTVNRPIEEAWPLITDIVSSLQVDSRAALAVHTAIGQMRRAIFTNAIGHADIEAIRQSVFDAGSLFRPYHSVNTDINKRIRYLSS